MEEIKNQILKQIKSELNSMDYHKYDVAVKQSEIIKNLIITYRLLKKED